MDAKFVVLLAMVAVTTAFDFSSIIYNLAGPYINDFKIQFRSQPNNNIQGHYSLLETDGSRTVDYAAGAGGYNTVRKDPTVIAAAAEQVSDPIVHSFPIRPIAPAPIIRTLPVRHFAPGPIIRTLPVRPIVPSPIFRTLPFRSIYPVPIHRSRSNGPFSSARISRILSFGANALPVKIRNIVSPFLYARHF